MICCDEKVEDVLKVSDFTLGNSETPMRFTVRFDIKGQEFEYSLAFDMPSNFKRLRVFAESFSCGGKVVFERSLGQVTLHRDGHEAVRFIVDWHRVALPIIQYDSSVSPIAAFRHLLSNILILSPSPDSIGSLVGDDGDILSCDCSDFVSWLDSLQRSDLRIGQRVVKLLQDTIYADLLSYGTVPGCDGNGPRLNLIFGDGVSVQKSLDFATLSDGEKCMFIYAAIAAKVEYMGCPLCLWDEPDNYLAVSEVRSFISRLRKSFKKDDCQLIVSSHNPEVIEALPPDHVRVFMRDSHLEPVREKRLDDVLKMPEERKHIRLLLLTGRLYDEEA